MVLYADDLVVLGNNRTSIQEAINSLEKWSRKNELKLNLQKTKLMKSRKGGRTSSKDAFLCGNCTVERLTLSTTRFTFTRYVEDRTIAAIKATMEIKRLRTLSLETALSLVNLKIAPVAS